MSPNTGQISRLPVFTGPTHDRTTAFLFPCSTLWLFPSKVIQSRRASPISAPPAPRHVPSPLQSEHTDCICCTMPGASCRIMMRTPRPRQALHFCTAPDFPPWLKQKGPSDCRPAPPTGGDGQALCSAPPPSTPMTAHCTGFQRHRRLLFLGSDFSTTNNFPWYRLNVTRKEETNLTS